MVVIAAEVGVASAALRLGFRLGLARSLAIDSLLTVLAILLAMAALERVVRVAAGRNDRGEPGPVHGVTFQVLLDVCVIWAAYYAAYRLRFGNGESLQINFEHFAPSLPAVLFTQIAVLALVGAYGRDSESTGTRRLAVLGKAVLLHGVGAQLVLLYFYAFQSYWGYSRGLFVIYAVVAVVLLAVSRTLRRAAREAPGRWAGATREGRLAFVLAGVCVGTGATWAVVVPPFEAPDELYISRLAFNAADVPSSTSYDPMYFVLVQPLLRLTLDAGIPFEVPTNPAFRFVSNRQGQVNMFQHGRHYRPAGRQLAALYALRAVAIALSTATVLLIYFMAARGFSNADVAFMIAGLCLFTPQFTFMGSKAHPEGLAVFWCAVINLVLISRATGRLRRATTWALLIPCVLAALFTDSVTYFLVAFVPVAMLLAEPDRRARRVTAGIITVAGLILAVCGYAFVRLSPAAGNGLGESLARLHLADLGKLANPFSPFLQAPDTLPYFLFEFWPKLFVGFWGWLGQPSVLLPAWTYAVLLDLTLVAAVGLAVQCVRRPDWSRLVPGVSTRVLLISGAGVIAMLVPIIYATVLWQRNAWYGRWLFPMIGPIMGLLTVGAYGFAAMVRKRPHAVAASIALAAAAAVVLWNTGPGGWIRLGVTANHYGDQARLIRTIRDALIGVALMPVLIELGMLLRKSPLMNVSGVSLRWPRGLSVPLTVFVSAGALNLALLFGFVRPLYQPLDAAGYLAAIQDETRRREFGRAAGVARIARVEYPESREIASLVSPAMLRARQHRELQQDLAVRIARREPIESRADLMALARTIRERGWPAGTAGDVLRLTTGRPDLGEEGVLLRLALDPPAGEAAGRALLAEAHATPVGVALRGAGSLEAFTIHPLPDGRHQVVIYFRPLTSWTGRRLWLHAYPAGSTEYVDLAADPPAFDGWRQDELAWEAFDVACGGPFDIYAGIAAGDDLGPAQRLGVVGVKK